MKITELDNFRITDAINFNSDLNPQLYLNEKMRPEIHRKLMEISRHFLEFLGVGDIALVDITLSGSNAAYTYTPHSDIDLHLIVDFSKLPHNEVYRELFDAKKYQYNDQHNIKVKGYDVELYVQDSAQPHVSLGTYSILHNTWERFPTKQRANINDDATKLKYNKLKNLAIRALASNNEAYLINVLDIVKRYRQAGLSQHGEFGPENLAFKILRKDGYFEKLWAKKRSYTDDELSMEALDDKPDTDLERALQDEFDSFGQRTAESVIQELYGANENLFDDCDYESLHDRASHIARIPEAAYAGNIGVMEVFEFFEKSTPKQQSLLNRLIKAEKFEEAWALLQKVTGKWLVGKKFNESSYDDMFGKDDMFNFYQKATPEEIGYLGRMVTANDKEEAMALVQYVVNSDRKRHVSEHGRIVKGVNTTADVGVDEIKIQAKKMGFNVTRDGVPPLLREGAEQLDELRMSPTSLQKQVNKILLSAQPIIGLEFEVCVKRDTEANPDVTKFTSMDDIREFFVFDDDNAFSEISAEYDEWINTKGDRWTENQINESVENPSYNSDKKIEIMVDDYVTSGEADEIIAKITGSEDDIEITTEMAKAVMEKAVETYKTDGDADEWPIQEHTEPHIALYYEIFIEDADIAREQLHSYFFDDFYASELHNLDEYSAGTWLTNSHINSMGDIFQNWPDELTWTGGAMAEGEFDEEVAGIIASGLTDIGLDTDVVDVDEYSTQRGDATWAIMSDESIKPADGDSGFEIVMPPTEYTEAIEDIRNVIDYLNTADAYTNESTGLHINVSLKSVDHSKLDYTKLVVMLGDSYILKQFGREINEYAVHSLIKLGEMMDETQGFTRDKAEKARAYAAVMVRMKKDLATAVSSEFDKIDFGKYASVGIKGDYIEFRSAGGVDHLNDIDEIIHAINRFIVTYAIACDPDAYRKEYGKKLYKLASNVGQGNAPKNSMTLFAAFGSGIMSKDDLIRQLKASHEAKKAEVDTGKPEVLVITDNNELKKAIEKLIRLSPGFGDATARDAIEDGIRKEIEANDISADEALPIVLKKLLRG